MDSTSGSREVFNWGKASFPLKAKHWEHGLESLWSLHGWSYLQLVHVLAGLFHGDLNKDTAAQLIFHCLMLLNQELNIMWCYTKKEWGKVKKWITGNCYTWCWFQSRLGCVKIWGLGTSFFLLPMGVGWSSLGQQYCSRTACGAPWVLKHHAWRPDTGNGSESADLYHIKT